MRKRKMYLSELLGRNTNKDIQITINTQFAYHYYDLSATSLTTLRKDGYLDKQVKSWYIRHSTTKVNIIITIDVD